jgi:hypothetical protein
MLAALDDAGIPWRLVFTKPSLAGLWAAAGAGLRVTVRTAISMPGSLAVLDPKTTQLLKLPTIPLVNTSSCERARRRSKTHQGYPVGQHPS